MNRPTRFIRNRLKIAAAQKEFGTLDASVWRVVGGAPLDHRIKSMKTIPAKSDAMSKDLLKRGFKFVGPTICDAFMQAVGMVNDHEIRCFRKSKIPTAPVVR